MRVTWRRWVESTRDEGEVPPFRGYSPGFPEHFLKIVQSGFLQHYLGFVAAGCFAILLYFMLARQGGG